MDEDIRYLIEQGEAWIREQRTLHRPDASPLNDRAATTLAPFFGPDILRDVRFKSVPVVENPGFYKDLEAAGRPIPIDFSDTHGITFEDTVLLSERYVSADGPPMSLLFHELVHMVQYRPNLVSTLHRHNVQLAFFFNGALEPDRFLEWRRAQLALKENSAKVLKHISKRGTPPPKAWWLPPCALHSMLRLALKTLNCSVVSTIVHR